MMTISVLDYTEYVSICGMDSFGFLSFSTHSDCITRVISIGQGNNVMGKFHVPLMAIACYSTIYFKISIKFFLTFLLYVQ